MMKNNPLVNWLPENHRLRFLNAKKFDVKMTYDALVAAEVWRYEHGCDTLTDEEVKNFGIRSHAIMGRDKF